MATQIWIGNAAAVAQVANATFATYDATTTRKITIGGVVVSALDTGGTLTTALTALAVVLNASTHPYFAAIMWTSNATQIIGTAKTAGVPFTFAGSVSGGTGTCSNAYTVATANAGPSSWATAANWLSGSAPVTDDDVVLKDSSDVICYDLDQSSVNLNTLRVMQSFSGKLGLDRAVFVTDANGATPNADYQEYRPTYLKIGLHSTGSKYASVGESYSVSSSANAGSKRVMIDFGTSAGTIEIFNTSSTSSESGRPAVRIKAGSASFNCLIRSAPGGFGIAADQVNETSTVGLIEITDTSINSKVITGPGTTLTTWTQYGGTSVMQAAATVPTINGLGGTLRTEGSFAVTAMKVYDGCTLYSNSSGTIATLTPNGGTIDFAQSGIARTVTSTVLPIYGTATIKADASVVTFTGVTFPAAQFQITAK